MGCTLIRAHDAEDARVYARVVFGLASDLTSLREATKSDEAWVLSMGGKVHESTGLRRGQYSWRCNRH